LAVLCDTCCSNRSNPQMQMRGIRGMARRTECDWLALRMGVDFGTVLFSFVGGVSGGEV
jgi:hypothetical protein